MAASPGRGSRSKGKSSELEVVHLAKPYFPDAERDWRTPQLHGDIRGIPGLHLECRRRETLSIEAWCKEVEAKADGRIPAVAFRRNNNPWRVALPLTALLNLLKPRQLKSFSFPCPHCEQTVEGFYNDQGLTQEDTHA